MDENLRTFLQHHSNMKYSLFLKKLKTIPNTSFIQTRSWRIILHWQLNQMKPKIMRNILLEVEH